MAQNLTDLVNLKVRYLTNKQFFAKFFLPYVNKLLEREVKDRRIDKKAERWNEEIAKWKKRFRKGSGSSAIEFQSIRNG